METICMNSENSKTNETHRFKLDLNDKLYLKNRNKNLALANCVFITLGKTSNQNTTAINLTFQHQLGMILLIYPMVLILLRIFTITLNLSLKKHETLTENPAVQIFPNKIKNRIVFKIKTAYKLELLTPETMKLLGSAKKDVDKDSDGENVPQLEYVQVVLVHCNLVKNDFQHTSKVLFTFVPNKQFGQLINISPHSLTMMNTVNTEFSFVEVWFTDQGSKALEIEDKVNLTLTIA